MTGERLAGKKFALSKKEVAKALELAEEGHYWWQIAVMLGVASSTLMRYVRGAERYGYSFWSENPRED
jgi:transposase-like protein